MSIATEPGPKLTARQLEILKSLAEGETSHEAGERLFISPRTVEFHRARLYEKLEVENKRQAIKRGAALGLITITD